MNVLDLFSGIGGFALGLERAGMRTVAFCERDRFCRDVLRRHWPDVPCFDDVRTLDADGLDRLGRIDLVSGGFPCQPFSFAGDQKGTQDNRHLWPEMRRVIALARPAWVLGENVAGIIPLALDDVLSDLEGLGYAARPFVIPACAVDAPHRRDRVWIIAADPAETRNDAQTLADSDLARQQERTQQHVRSLHREQSSPGNHAGGCSGPARWSPEPDVDRVAHGVSHRVDRLRAVGNAVVPGLVEALGRAILMTMTQQQARPPLRRQRA